MSYGPSEARTNRFSTWLGGSVKYTLSIAAMSEPGALSTWIYVNVDRIEATGDGLTTTSVFHQRRELIWDIGQDISVKNTCKEGAQRFIDAAGLADPF